MSRVECRRRVAEPLLSLSRRQVGRSGRGLFVFCVFPAFHTSEQELRGAAHLRSQYGKTLSQLSLSYVKMYGILSKLVEYILLRKDLFCDCFHYSLL